MLSLTTMGTPPSGRQEPFLRLASKASAALIAPASSSVMKALRFGLALARVSAAEVNALLEILPAQRSAAACVAVSRSRSTAPCAAVGDRDDPAEPTRLTIAALYRSIRRRPMGF